jgi:hypothetical protein
MSASSRRVSYGLPVVMRIAGELAGGNVVKAPEC